MRRNRDKHTDTATVEDNILTALREAKSPLPMSYLAYAGFPGYKFRSAQGAALCVSRIASSMAKRQLIYFKSSQYERGWVAV